MDARSFSEMSISTHVTVGCQNSESYYMKNFYLEKLKTFIKLHVISVRRKSQFCSP